MKSYTRWALLSCLVAIATFAFIDLRSNAAGQNPSQQSTKQKGGQDQAEPTAAERGQSKDKLKNPVKAKPTPDISEEADEADDLDADRPEFAKGLVNHAEYLRRRQEWVNLKLGMEPGKPYNPGLRQVAVEQMKVQEAQIKDKVSKGIISPLVSSNAWTNIGPFPLPNGQTNQYETAVSGRVPTIVVHPTNPDIVYVGAAQGGVYRSTNGGQTWTQLFNTADSQVIGALAISPSNPEIVYVGTGEAGQCGSGCYAGIGVYRIDNASTTADLTGPINPQITTGTTTPITYNAFTGRSISEILVAPTDPSVIFVATASAIVGNPSQAPQGGTIPPLGIRGLYRINNANGPIAGMTIAKLTVTPNPGGFDVPSTGNLSILDIAFDTGDTTGNTLVAWAVGVVAANNGGAYRTTNALTTGTFVQTLPTQLANARGEFGVTRAGGVTTMYVATGETGVRTGCTAAGQGAVRRSVDGGATWSARLQGGSGFCGGQCFYDIAIDVSPTDANTFLLGGNTPGTCTRNVGRSTDGGATVVESSAGLHADDHAMAYAPSNPQIVYNGNDGGIFRSNDGGTNWQSLNNRTFVATQFNSVASHPTERMYILGGTQDNGTELLQPTPNSQRPFDGWKNADFGDGGYARIDQLTSPDAENVVLYHTYFNQTNAQAIARVTATSQANKGTWTTFGCGFSGTVPNGFNCVTTTAILFYAPFELGPATAGATGQPVYWGADALYRSGNQAATFVLASQQPIVSGQPVTTIGISAASDNYRMVGLNNGTVWGQTSGLPTVVNITPVGAPARAVGRVYFDPNNLNTAYIAYGGQAIGAASHIYKTTTFNTLVPAMWTASGSGIPDVPVNGFIVDPNNSMVLFAGTDVGVYRSTDAGANWLPYNNGMPKIAIFDMAIQNSNRLLRVATHGRGIWEIALDPAVSISGQITGAGNSGVTVNLTGSAPGPMSTITDGGGNYSFTGLSVGGNYTVTPVANATRAFTPPSITFSDIPSSRTGVNFVTTAPATGTFSPGQVLISEFRLRGPGGAADEFIELYNNTDAAITVATTDGSAGWALDAADAVGNRFNAAVVPVNTVIPARGHYLLAARNYSLRSRATGDLYYTASMAQEDISDNTGIALYSTANRANFAAGNRLDAVGFTGAPVQDREGAGLTPVAVADVDQSFPRIFVEFGLPRDTNNNIEDFLPASPTATIGATSVRLGAPGPENLQSAIGRGSTVVVSRTDPGVGFAAAPNYVRNGAETGTNKQFGTLTLRRRFTNNTGSTIRRLQFRIIDITTLGAPANPPGTADLRFLDSTDVIVTTTAGQVLVSGTVMNQPPVQTLGGGFNTVLDIAALQDGLPSTVGGVCPPTTFCTIDVQFKLGVMQNGTFRFIVLPEVIQ